MDLNRVEFFSTSGYFVGYFWCRVVRVLFGDDLIVRGDGSEL